jgi:hypothetical protein
MNIFCGISFLSNKIIYVLALTDFLFHHSKTFILVNILFFEIEKNINRSLNSLAIFLFLRWGMWFYSHCRLNNSSSNIDKKALSKYHMTRRGVMCRVTDVSCHVTCLVASDVCCVSCDICCVTCDMLCDMWPMSRVMWHVVWHVADVSFHVTDVSCHVTDILYHVTCVSSHMTGISSHMTRVSCL